jgi:hypothetical protein
MAALDSCQAEWQAAEAGRQALLRTLGDKAQAASRHAVGRMATQVGSKQGVGHCTGAHDKTWNSSNLER